MDYKIDLTGKTFGYWTVLKFAGRNPSGYRLWTCQCKCGTVKDLIGHTLTTGSSRSCGCMGHKISKDRERIEQMISDGMTIPEIAKITGHKRMSLQAAIQRWSIKASSNKTKNAKVGDIINGRELLEVKDGVWKVKCLLCGKIAHRGIFWVRTKKCLCTGDRKSNAEVLWTELKGKANNKRHKREFSLTVEDIERLSFDDCIYCGAKPANVFKRKSDRTVVYSGLDRLDCSKGYIKNNVVPCCWRCNTTKNDKSLEGFIDYCGMIWKNRNKIHKKVKSYEI